MIKLYGISASRTLRPLWLLEEIGLEYELVPIDFKKGDNTRDDYLAINPNGKIPAMTDGDLVLYESMAINFYIAKNYGGNIYPEDPATEALAMMWSFWVMTEVEYSLLTVLMNTRVLPEEKRDPDRVSRNIKQLEKPFSILNNTLQGRQYLISDDFSIADLNVSAVLSWCRPARVNLDQWPELNEWLLRCIKRPAFKAAAKR